MIMEQELINMKINNIEISAKYFGYDGCHKIYLIETEEQRREAQSSEYTVLHISKLKKTFENSCGLRFISSWDLSKSNIVDQCEEAEFS